MELDDPADDRLPGFAYKIQLVLAIVSIPILIIGGMQIYGRRSIQKAFAKDMSPHLQLRPAEDAPKQPLDGAKLRNVLPIDVGARKVDDLYEEPGFVHLQPGEAEDVEFLLFLDWRNDPGQITGGTRMQVMAELVEKKTGKFVDRKLLVSSLGGDPPYTEILTWLGKVR